MAPEVILVESGSDEPLRPLEDVPLPEPVAPLHDPATYQPEPPANDEDDSDA